jgi:hypothetical protein
VVACAAEPGAGPPAHPRLVDLLLDRRDAVDRLRVGVEVVLRRGSGRGRDAWAHAVERAPMRQRAGAQLKRRRRRALVAAAALRAPPSRVGVAPHPAPRRTHHIVAQPRLEGSVKAVRRRPLRARGEAALLPRLRHALEARKGHLPAERRVGRGQEQPLAALRGLEVVEGVAARAGQAHAGVGAHGRRARRGGTASARAAPHGGLLHGGAAGRPGSPAAGDGQACVLRVHRVLRHGRAGVVLVRPRRSGVSRSGAARRPGAAASGGAGRCGAAPDTLVHAAAASATTLTSSAYSARTVPSPLWTAACVTWPGIGDFDPGGRLGSMGRLGSVGERRFGSFNDAARGCGLPGAPPAAPGRPRSPRFPLKLPAPARAARSGQLARHRLGGTWAYGIGSSVMGGPGSCV